MSGVTGPNRIVRTGLVVICLLFFSAGLLRLNDLSLYTPDSTRYMIWGHSLAEGKGFLDDTQPEPDRFVLHAPLYPLLIAPVEFLFPLSLTAVKIYTLMLGAGAIILFWFLLRRLFQDELLALAGTLLLACNPLILVYSSEALSEAPFIASVLLLFLLFEKSVSSEVPDWLSRTGWILGIIGVSLLREVGIAAVAALTVALITRRRYKHAALVVALAIVAIGLWYFRNQILVGPPPGSQKGNMSFVGEHLLTPQDASLFSELGARAWLNLKGYGAHLSGMLFWPLYATQQVNLIVEPHQFPDPVKYVLMICVGAAMVVGAGSDIRSSQTAWIRILFVTFYLVLILIYPVFDVRFLVPLLPVMIFFFLRGFDVLARGRSLIPKERFGVAVAAASVLMVVPNVLVSSEILQMNRAYVASPAGLYEELKKNNSLNSTMYAQPWSIVGEWVRTNVPEDAVFASPAKELAVVVGDRKVMELDPGLTLTIFETLLRDNGVQYLLTPMRWRDVRVYEFLMAESRRFWFEPVYRVSSLEIVKVHSRHQEPVARMDTAAIDTTTPMGMLKQGRLHIRREEYGDAIRLLTRGVQHVPNQPELVYQTIVAHAMTGDSANAQRYYQQLLSLPQVASYLFLARLQLHEMTLSMAAEAIANPEERTIRLNELALDYWRQGYYQRAARLANEAIEADSTYFVGLLWGFHFNFQTGNRPLCEKYLKYLKAIDDTNQIVRGFGRLLALKDSLAASTDPLVRSDNHVSAGRIFETIELFDEMIDEAELALCENPHNSEARIMLAQAYAKRNRPRRSDHYYRSVLAYDPTNAVALANTEGVGQP